MSMSTAFIVNKRGEVAFKQHVTLKRNTAFAQKATNSRMWAIQAVVTDAQVLGVWGLSRDTDVREYRETQISAEQWFSSEF